MIGALGLLDSIPLSNSELLLVKKLREDPNSRAFLPVADILRHYNFYDESIELMVSGVMRHPNFSVARVILVRELFDKGLVHEALQTLEDSPESLQSNVLAQKIRFKIYLVLGREGLFRESDQYLTSHQLHDRETLEISERLREVTFQSVRKSYLEKLNNFGSFLFDEKEVTINESEISDSFYDKKLQDRIRGFHVVPLGEIFSEEIAKEKSGFLPGHDLDSRSLAAIYFKQGHYKKAIEVYDRLLVMAPGDDFVRSKKIEATEKLEEQREIDQNIDRETVRRMEKSEHLDRQIDFLEGLLTKIG